MSAPDGHSGGSKMTPGTVFAYLFLGGLGVMLLLIFLSIGIDSFGAVKRRYPEVIVGFVTIGLLAALFAGSGKKGGGGGDHH